MKKKNWLTISILTATVVLAIIAVVTALRLYQLREEPVAPTAPQPAPAIAPTATPTWATQLVDNFEVSLESPSFACTLSFNVGGGPTSTPTPTGTPEPTSTPPADGPTSTPVPGATTTPTPIPLPEAGITLPTWLTALASASLLILGLLLAL